MDKPFQMNKPFLEEVLELSKKQFLKEGSIFPTFHAVTAQDKHIIVATPWTNHREKMEAIMAVRLIFWTEQVTEYAMTSEFWLVECNFESEKKYREWRKKMGPEYSLENYPGRKEGLMLIHVTKDSKEMTRYIIQREPKLTLTRQLLPDVDIKGDMTELLPPPFPMNEDQRALALFAAKTLGMIELDRKDIN